MKWKVYYIDNSTFSDQDGSPWRTPGLGVLLIVRSDPDCGWRTEIGDYYVWDCRGGETHWWGVDEVGYFEYMFTKPGYKYALLGTKTSNKQFYEVFERATNDPDFPPKTAFANKERKL